MSCQEFICPRQENRREQTDAVANPPLGNIRIRVLVDRAHHMPLGILARIRLLGCWWTSTINSAVVLVLPGGRSVNRMSIWRWMEISFRCSLVVGSLPAGRRLSRVLANQQTKLSCCMLAITATVLPTDRVELVLTSEGRRKRPNVTAADRSWSTSYSN